MLGPEATRRNETEHPPWGPLVTTGSDVPASVPVLLPHEKKKGEEGGSEGRGQEKRAQVATEAGGCFGEQK